MLLILEHELLEARANMRNMPAESAETTDTGDTAECL